MKTYQYKSTTKRDYPEIDVHLNKMGADGWLFIGVDADYFYWKLEI